MNRLAIALGLLVLAAGSPPLFAQGNQSSGAAATPAGREVKVTEKILPLRIPGETIGETEGVSLNSAGHLFVFSRTGWSGSSRGGNAARVFEFDKNLKYVKEWIPNAYGLSFAHGVRVDPKDNVWVVDEGSNMIIKVDPTGLVAMVLGRKPESIDWWEERVERGVHDPEGQRPKAQRGTYNRPTDVAWGPDGSIFIADGYNNSRVVKLSPDGSWLKEYGSYGSGDGQFNIVHSIAAGYGHVYVADRTNRRIQVFDSNGTYLRSLVLNVVYDKTRHPTLAGLPANPAMRPDETQPWALCITNGPTQYLFAVDDEPGRLYKMQLDGKILGVFGESGHQIGQFNWPHAIACPSENVIYVADMNNWRIQKLVAQ